MRKQLMILSLSLLCTALVVVIFPYTQSNLNAMSSTYNLGEKVTTRINKAPSNLSGSKTEIGFKSGDKIAIEAGGGNNAWQLHKLKNYTTYNCSVTLNQAAKPTRCTKPAINAWLSLSTKTLVSNIAFTTHTAMKSSPWIVFNDQTKYYGWSIDGVSYGFSVLPYRQQSAVGYIETFNTQLNTTKDKDLITYNDESDFYSIVNDEKGLHQNGVVNILISGSGPDSFGKKSFLPNRFSLEGLSNAQRKFNSDI